MNRLQRFDQTKRKKKYMLPKHTIKLLKTICKAKASVPMLSYALVSDNKLTASDFETTITLPDINVSPGVYNPRTNTMEFIDMSEFTTPEYKSVNATQHTINLKALSIALKHATTDETRYNLHGVAVSSKGFCISCDGHRAYVQSTDNLDVAFILSYQSTKILIELMKALSIADITLNYDKGNHTITSTHYNTRTLDAQYPDISQILPASTLCKMLDTKATIQACKRAITLLKSIDRDTAVHNKSNTNTTDMIISPKVSPSETYIIGDSSKLSLDIKLNARYLLEAIEHHKEKSFDFCIDPKHEYGAMQLIDSVIMPIRK
jgi:DNA polymerase III sliding clamp (beta) subunit (PCNA family)